MRNRLAKVAVALAAVAGLTLGVASPASAASKWMWAYGAYTNVYNAQHQTIGQSEWQNIYVYCQAKNFGGVWGNQIYLWAYVPYATPSGARTGWVDGRNVNNFDQSGIAGISWCW